MKILITGVAGFIGTNLSIYFLKKKHKVYGIDNFDDYNSKNLKKFRLKILRKEKNFFFNKIDITNRKNLFKYFANKKIDLIIHLAGQAGVRYSMLNPSKYINNNIIGFLNIIFSAKKNKVKKIIYASSSSVYGDSIKFPSKETHKLRQKNIYAVSKKLNEKIAETYSKLTNINFIGLRFFTIYGEFGRPDMFLFKLFKSSISKKTFEINNFGNHLRDFTYIGDVNKIVYKLSYKKINKNEIFNICSNYPINILKIAKYFNKKHYLKIDLVNRHEADILKTHGDNSKVKKITKFKKFTKLKDKLFKIYHWYKNNKINKL